MKRSESSRPARRSAKQAVAAQPGPSLLSDFVGQLIPSALSVAAFSTIFDPIRWWPLTFVCLFPWAAAVVRAHRAWLAHWMSFATGAAFFLINLTWLMPVTGLGYIALALYLAVYWPLASWALRSARRRGIPLTISLPIVWVATEFLRGIAMSGFPWLFLGHGLYKMLTLIQISDVVGAYGVSFLAGVVNGFIADVYVSLRARPKGALPIGRLAAPATVVVLTVALTVAYGTFRLRTSTFEKGPRIAVIQEDFPAYNDPRLNTAGPIIFAANLRLGADAALEEPEIIVFPETPWSGIQNLEFVSVKNNAVEGIAAWRWQYGIRYHQATSAFARGDYATANRIIRDFARVLPRHEFPQLPESGGRPAVVVLGSVAVETFPEDIYPRVRKTNSALVYDSNGQQRAQRYDKTHLVPFGEQVPFRYGRFHWLYLWLNGLSPFSGPDGAYEYSLTPGSEFTVFEVNTAAGKMRFGTPICYEDVMPYVSREFVAGDPQKKGVDFLLNISNDGWFSGSQQPQHLAICVFRAVENRVGFARAVNTGVSAFIDPNGFVHDVVRGDPATPWPGVAGYAVANVQVDSRYSFYSKYGDWFAWLCALVWGIFFVDYWLIRARERRKSDQESVPTRERKA
ncbi:MAG: apolipoprotein N-acyltransferase [Planctomycetes bacterium]|nr:apolipoprotein N-acyltransferase [Planctomycetota bacterium]